MTYFSDPLFSSTLMSTDYDRNLQGGLSVQPLHSPVQAAVKPRLLRKWASGHFSCLWPKSRCKIKTQAKKAGISSPSCGLTVFPPHRYKHLGLVFSPSPNPLLCLLLMGIFPFISPILPSLLCPRKLRLRASSKSTSRQTTLAELAPSWFSVSGRTTTVNYEMVF
jgi:hypothetical protein